MSGGSEKVTVGYQYYLGIHMALCHGPIDKITQVQVDRRVAWEGLAEGGPITIDAPDLFGGKSREGGVSGTVDIEMGGPDQAPNSYLQSVLGTDMPAFRGVTCAVLNQVYTGNNPYLKPWSFTAQRIHVRMDGQVQWYDAYSEIPRTNSDTTSTDGECLPYACDAFSAGINASIVDSHWPFPNPENSDFTDHIGSRDFVQDGAFTDTQSTNIWGDAQGANNGCDAIQGYRLDHIPPASGNQRLNITGSVLDLWGGAVNSGIAFGVMLKDIQESGAGFGAQVFTFQFRATNGGSGDLVFYIHPGANEVTITNTVSPTTVAYAFENQDPQYWICTIERTVGSGTYRLNMYKDFDPTRIITKSTQLPGAIGFDIDYGSSANIMRAFGAFQRNTFKDAVLFSFSSEDDKQSKMAALKVLWDRNFLSYTVPDGCGVCGDMNPAHIIRECLTDPDWGMGYADADIDDTAFKDAANTLFAENMGISLLWEREMPLEDFIAEILRHIDAVLYVDRTTGKFVLSLIRGDYAESNLLVLDETNASQIKDARRPTVGELTSSVTVNYWDGNTGETGSVTQHNQALIQVQGAVKHTTIQYPGFTNNEIAQRVAIRDLTALSTSLLSCSITANREASTLNIGDAFILDWPDLGINSQVMRVQQMGLGDGRDNAIKIDAVEDVFATPTYLALGDGDVDNPWVDPTTLVPAAAAPRLVTESPYYQLVLQSGETQVNNIIADDSDAGFLLTAGGRQGSELNANLHIDSGAGYSQFAYLDFAPYAYLAAPIGETDTQIYLTGGNDLDDVEDGTIAQIGDELIRVDSLTEDSSGTFIIAGRGILDTVPAEHGSDSVGLDSNSDNNRSDTVIFWGGSTASDNVQYTASDSIDVKMQTVLGSNVYPFDSTPVDSVTMASRAYRPYPPGRLAIDGESYPEANSSSEIYWTGVHDISWTHRDRLQQTDGNLYDYTEGNIGPEDGTTYRIDIYSTLQNGTVTSPWWTVDGIATTSYSMDSNTDTSRGEPAPETELVHVKVTSVRDGYESWQSPVATLSYVSDSVGDSVGVFDSVGGFDSLGSNAALWTPAETTTKLWLDASDATTITGTPTVTDWVDKSGNSYNFSALGNPQTAATTQNGLNVIDFDGTGDYFQSDDTVATWKFLHDGTEHQIYSVYELTSAAGYFILGATHNASTTTVGAYYSANDGAVTNGLRHFVANSSSGNPSVDNITAGISRTGGAALVSLQADPDNGTAADRSSFEFAGGTADESNTDATAVSAANPQHTLQINAVNGTAYNAGFLAEQIIVVGAFSQSLHDKINGYLAWKWGLEADLPSGHPYEDAAPVVEVDELWGDVISSTDFEVGAVTTAPTDFKTASVWTQSGASGISDSSAEYGTKSGYVSTSGYMLLKNADLALGTSDFCIDVSLKAGHAATTHFIFDGRPVSTNGDYPALAKINNKVSIFVDNTVVATSTSDVANNDWTKIRWERVGGTSTLYMDGVVEDSFADTYDYLYSATNGWAVGSSGFSLGTLVLAGNIDSWRVTATSRDGAAYTPATEPFPTQ